VAYWKEQNSRVFDKFATMPAIKLEADHWVATGFRRLPALLVRWSPMVFA
jgi:hypothetical protein